MDSDKHTVTGGSGTDRRTHGQTYKPFLQTCCTNFAKCQISGTRKAKIVTIHLFVLYILLWLAIEINCFMFKALGIICNRQKPGMLLLNIFIQQWFKNIPGIN